MFWSEIIAKNVRYGLRKLAKMKAKWKNTKLKNLQGWQGTLLRTNSTSRLVHEALACPAYPWFITTCTDYSCRKIMEAWPLLIAAVDWVSGWRRTRLVVWLKWISLPSTEAYNIQMFKMNHLQVFLKSIFVTPLLRNSYPVNCALSGI